MSLVSSFFHAWERRLAYRDDFERQVLPFEWGARYLPGGAPGEDIEDERAFVHDHVEGALANTESYFDYKGTEGFDLFGDELRFPSPVRTDTTENNLARGRLFRAEKARSPAIIVLPHWNAREGAQEGLCRLANHYGLTALRLVLPYHERRRPEGAARADRTLSPSIGRTIQSIRQAVLETRAAARWLARIGHDRIGIVGTSLGSCIAFIAFAHEPALRSAVFNHISPYFADVVWHGISTRQVREALESGVDLEELRKLWLPLSPFSYYRKVGDRRCLLIYGRYDLSFPVDQSRELLDDFRRLEIEHESFELPCGHYTTAVFPFNWMDGLAICRFLSRELRS